METEDTVQSSSIICHSDLGKQNPASQSSRPPVEWRGVAFCSGASVAGAGSWQRPQEVRRGAGLVEGVGVGSDHHHHFLE